MSQVISRVRQQNPLQMLKDFWKLLIPIRQPLLKTTSLIREKNDVMRKDADLNDVVEINDSLIENVSICIIGKGK